jgi:two-component system probable response regulator PhcQ
MYRILIVDDETNVLNALRRELQETYQIETFSSPVEALERCKSEAFDLVIVDYKMPGMDGIQFLRQFDKLQPDAARVVLSGEADFDAVVGSINEMHIYRFIAKPWDKTELVVTLAQALAHNATLLENRRLAEICRKQIGWQRARDPNKLYQVLVVDDEQYALNAVVRDLTARDRFDDLHMVLLHEADQAFRVAAPDFRYRVYTETSPLRALEVAKQLSFDVVISDYLMPEMDGLRFLEAFRQVQPDAARILLSGQADRETLVSAINRSEIYSFIGKPWREYVLKSTVAQAVAFHDLQRENRNFAGLLSGRR